MLTINYDLRNEWYSNNEYDLQKLVGKKFLGIDYKTSDWEKWDDVQAYETLLKWEGFVMSFISPSKREIPIVLNEYVNCKLEDWGYFPNHACDMAILRFEGFEGYINFNIFRGIKWEEV